MAVVSPLHPGEVLREEFLVPLELSVYRLAQELGISRPAVNQLVREKATVSPRMAALLGKYFGTSAQFWLNLQAQYDVRLLDEDPDIQKALAAVIPRASRKVAEL